MYSAVNNIGVSEPNNGRYEWLKNSFASGAGPVFGLVRFCFGLQLPALHLDK